MQHQRVDCGKLVALRAVSCDHESMDGLCCNPLNPSSIGLTGQIKLLCRTESVRFLPGGMETRHCRPLCKGG